MSRSIIKNYYNNLDEFSKKLIEHYIETDYVPKVRTGLGKKNNFLYEHNSTKGIEIIKEIIKFKKIQFISGYLTFSSKKNVNFVTTFKKDRYNK